MNNNVVIDMAINALTGTLLGPLFKGKTNNFCRVYYKNLRNYMALKS